MNFTNIDFCPTMGKLNTKVVSALLADGLFAGSEKAKCLLATRYEQMKMNCGNVPHGDSRWNLDGIVADKTDKAALLPVPHIKMGDCGTLVNQLWDHQNFDLDMPTWMVKRGVKDPCRVTIVSQDPLRTNHKAGALVLSTPFGFHSADYRSISCQNRTLCCFVERLLEECEACVYLTDCRKFYTSDNFVNSHKGQFKGLFGNVLNDELKAFAPDLIVTLGNYAADAIAAKRPRAGLAVQSVNNLKVLAAYHTGARPNHFKNVVESGRKSDYFDEVFKVVHKELEKRGKQR